MRRLKTKIVVLWIIGNRNHQKGVEAWRMESVKKFIILHAAVGLREKFI